MPLDTTLGDGAPHGDIGYKLLARLPAALSWRDDNEDLLIATDSLHRMRVLTALKILDATLSDRLQTLTSEAQLRFLFAPQISKLLLSNAASLGQAKDLIADYLANEEYISGYLDTRLTNGGWTALGDCYVSGSDGAGALPFPAAAFGHSGRLFHAVRANRIVLDGFSPFAFPIFPESYGPKESYPAADFRNIASRLERALDFADRSCAQAGAFVNGVIRVVAIAKMPAAPDVTNSSSRQSSIGMAGLSNVHNEIWTEAKLADALIHEAIHSLIFKIELAAPFYRNPEAAQHTSIVSPWSGRTLTLPQFVHASFVWYGLCCFWSTASRSPDTIQYLSKAQGGFLASPFPLFEISVAEYVHDEVLEAVRNMLSHVRSLELPRSA